MRWRGDCGGISGQLLLVALSGATACSPSRDQTVKGRAQEGESLRVRTVGAADDLATPVVLLHGFGAPGDDLLALGYRLSDAGRFRFFFPEGPIDVGGGRAWWNFRMSQLPTVDAARRGVPKELASTRERLRELFHRPPLRRRGDLVLGGFSQGAMSAFDVALYLAATPSALVLLSTGYVAESEWAPRLKRLAGIPVFMSHGRHDPLVPFESAVVLQHALEKAGAHVTFVEFDGAHEIPPAVVGRLRGFLTMLQRVGRK